MRFFFLIIVLGLWNIIGCDSDSEVTSMVDMEVQEMDAGVQDMEVSDEMDMIAPDLELPDQELEDLGTSMPCLGGSRFGLKTDLIPIETSLQGPQSAPKFASFDQMTWGVIWLTSTNEGSNLLYFQRFERQEMNWTSMGDPLFLGRSQGGQHHIHATNTGFTILWINQSNSTLNQEGIFIASIDQDGSLTQDPVVVPQSFGTQYLSSEWKVGLGGVLVYSKMNQGLLSYPFDQNGVIGEANEITVDMGIRSPHVVFGGGGWAASWIKVGSDAPLVRFALLTESGSLSGEVRTIETSADPIPPLHIAYGNGAYILGYSISDPRVLGNEPARLILDVRLLDENGSNLGQFPITEGEGNLRLSSIAWLNPSIFALVWQDYVSPHAALGITRVNELGQPLSSVFYKTEPHTLLAEAQLVGTSSESIGILTQDPTPSPTGLFSDSSQAMFMHLGVCEGE